MAESTSEAGPLGPIEGSAAAWVHYTGLVPWVDNPRDNERAVPKVAASIRRYGFVAPVVVWLERNRMVAGHTRVLAMRALCQADPSFAAKGAPAPGLVRVVYHSFSSEAEADAYAIADNRLGELAAWDEPKLAEVMARLPAEDLAIVALDDTPVRQLVADDVAARPRGPARLGMARVLCGDVLATLATLPAGHFDAVLSDPPYGLTYAGKRWDVTVPLAPVWSACVRVCRPGAHLAAFSSDRTYHRLACAIEDGGLEIRAMLPWLYGEGFPKSVNLPHALERHGLTGAELQDATETWEGHVTGIKPACEPACLARVPLDGTLAHNLLTHGTGALWLDGTRLDRGSWPTTVLLDDTSAAMLDGAVGERPSTPYRANSDAGDSVHPANRGHRTAGGYADTGGPSRFFYVAKPSRAERDRGCEGLPLVTPAEATGSKAGAARLASPRTGAGRSSGVRNHHPTLKPVSLMRHLAALLLPPPREDGQPRRLLVPYSGSGSEIIGALLAGWDEVVGIELDPRYVEIAAARIDHARHDPEAWCVEGTWHPADELQRDELAECDDCAGTGRYGLRDDDTCPSCNGSGHADELANLDSPDLDDEEDEGDDT